MTDKEYIESRYLDAREEVASSLLEMILRGCCTSQTPEDSSKHAASKVLGCLFPNLLPDGTQITMGHHLHPDTRKMPRKAGIGIPSYNTTNADGGNTWDHLFARKTRTADIVFSIAAGKRRGSCIVEVKKAGTGFYVQQLLLYHLSLLHEQCGGIRAATESNRFDCIICPVVHSVDKNHSMRLMLKDENKHLLDMKRSEKPRGDLTQQRAWVLSAVERAIEELHAAIVAFPGKVSFTKPGNIEIVRANLHKIVPDRMYVKSIVETKSKNEHWDKIELLSKDKGNVITWYFIPWSGMNWDGIAEAVEQNGRSQYWRKAVACEAEMISKYYAEWAPKAQ